jgi:BirA family biotin operon repressor/biotin-[acetyl-CoA-carboxylase] ligase
MPESSFAEQVSSRLTQNLIGRPLLHYAQISSTNLEMKAKAGQGWPHGACLSADFQSAGRGRLNRAWQARPGSSLLFSLLLRPPAIEFAFTALAALAVSLSLEAKDLRPQIKWPNDIYWRKAKLGGILSEAAASALIIGIGLNVNQEREELAGVGQEAVSLKMAGNQSWDRPALLADILNHFAGLYQKWRQTPDFWLPLYQERCWLLGQEVEVIDNDLRYQGTALALKADGSLLLATAGGQLALRCGDVSLRAPGNKKAEK